MEPRLRTVNKATAPYELNKFPSQFIETFAKNVVYMRASKPVMSLEGEEWEEIFSECINAEWKPSNVGLDDVVLDNCCWSAKTVFSSANMELLDKVRLISGRNSPVFSFGVDNIATGNPDDVGKMVLDIWNERVSGIREIFKFARTIVLVKEKSFNDFLIFEFNTVRYDPELYYFQWNKRGNLEGYDKNADQHRFTWQPHGSQFTIIEDVPKERLHLSIKEPEKLDRQHILDSVGFDSTWYSIVSSERPE